MECIDIGFELLHFMIGEEKVRSYGVDGDFCWCLRLSVGYWL